MMPRFLLFLASVVLVACSSEEAANDGTQGVGKASAGGAAGRGGAGQGAAGQGAAGSGGGGEQAGGAQAGGAGGGVAGGAGAGGAVCVEAQVKFERGKARVVVLVDQSLSMDKAFGGGSRWTVLRDALMDPTKGFIKALEAEMDFGLTLYTGTAASCPLLVSVPAAPMNYAAIKAAYDAAVPIDNTPTGPSVAALTAQLKALPGDTPRHIVLATDGDPDTCEIPNPSNDTEKNLARKTSVDAVKAAYDAGIKTHVIGVGKEIGSAHLQDLANAGEGKSSGASAQYAVALDPDTLAAALSEAIYGARSCSFALNGKITKGQESTGTVLLDGNPLAYGQDWKATSESTVELVGKACEQLQVGEPSVSITFPCGGAFTPEIN
jgi:hypothetical protein